LYYLAGLTCNEDTAPWKAGFLRDASEERLALVFPDTSPRGARVQIKDEDWDFGTGTPPLDLIPQNYDWGLHIL